MFIFNEFKLFCIDNARYLLKNTVISLIFPSAIALKAANNRSFTICEVLHYNAMSSCV
jgi:hypothetical protein